MSRIIDWKAIEDDYIRLNGDVNLKEFADKHGVKYSTLRSRKNRGNWDDKLATKNATKIKSVAINKKATDDEIVQVAETLKESSKLTEMQQLFCLYYIRSFNATQSAIKAGYSPRSAMEQGYQLLQKPSVKKEIERLKDLKKKSIMIDEDDIVERYMRIAFADMTDFVDFGVREVPIITKEGPVMIRNPKTGEEEPMTQNINSISFKDSAVVDGGLICEIKTSRQGASIKLEDRQKALDWLAKYFDMNPDNKYKREFDNRKLQLEKDRFEHQKQMDGRKMW